MLREYEQQVQQGPIMRLRLIAFLYGILLFIALPCDFRAISKLEYKYITKSDIYGYYSFERECYMNVADYHFLMHRLQTERTSILQCAQPCGQAKRRRQTPPNWWCRLQSHLTCVPAPLLSFLFLPSFLLIMKAAISLD